MLECIFLPRFQPHVCFSYNFSPVQSAYRRHHSTETALLHTLNSIYWSSEQGQPSVPVSLDMSAAFDTIDHHTLLTRTALAFLAWLAHGLNLTPLTAVSGAGTNLKVGGTCLVRRAPENFFTVPLHFFRVPP